jgi:hypothetical protein
VWYQADKAICCVDEESSTTGVGQSVRELVELSFIVLLQFRDSLVQAAFLELEYYLLSSSIPRLLVSVRSIVVVSEHVIAKRSNIHI